MRDFWHNTALILTIIGGLNWGFVGAFDFDLVAFIFGYMSVLSRIVYVLVGISALAMIFVPACSLRESLEHKMN